MQKILEVKNLRISFRTINGKVQATRDISFDLYRGDTLAIVGESGSGKSVTSKAILGISSNNAILESGEIIYDGKNLLTLSEEEFHKIRGDKIAMIFQDPLSSLNPIMKIGKQLTEAMLLKGKARQKECRTTFNSYLEYLAKNMKLAVRANSSDAKLIDAKCHNFDKFEYKHVELERDYNFAKEALDDALIVIDNQLFKVEKNAIDDIKYMTSKAIKDAKSSIHEYLVWSRKDELVAAADAVKASVKLVKTDEGKKTYLSNLSLIKEILTEANGFVVPNFFTMGYYLTFSKEPLPEGYNVEQLNEFLRKYIDENFMLDFISYTTKAIEYSAKTSNEAKKEFLDFSKEMLLTFSKEDLDKKECEELIKRAGEILTRSANKLSIVKDSKAYTFCETLNVELDKYFGALKRNELEQKRFERDTSKYNKIVSSGKIPSWNVAPLSLVDKNDIKASVIHHVERFVEHYERAIAKFATRNFEQEGVNVIDFLKENASGVVNKVTRNMAKNKALSLMEEVGIPEPRKRYNQYPFEFSGGMRQRIVIAIALAANPDILICDEPTTALDVTIQAQILELINKLKEKRHLAIIFITHDLGVVANMADRIAVMYAGKIVEYGTSEDIFYSPAHPYTWALLSSMPDLDTNEKLEAIPGTPPNMIYPPVGDAFADRNKYALKIDYEQQPPFFKISDTHYAATWLLHPNAPKINPPKAITDRIERMKASYEKASKADTEAEK